VPASEDQLDVVGALVEALRHLGMQPVLVGGMALVVLGSRRVTRDFDLLVKPPGARLQDLVRLFYDRGLELASRLNENGDVVATIAARRVAATRLRLDVPESAFFLNPETGLRVDLLFDFPVSAEEIASNATRVTIRSHRLDVASAADLLRLKRIARKRRSLPGDAEDIAFLERLTKTP
jgi:hypothetical protein